MFHLFNKVYVVDDKEIDNRHDCIIIHPQHGINYVAEYNIQAVYTSLEDCLQKDYSNYSQYFIDYLLEKKDKFYIYTDTPTLVKLQIALWKSIFKEPTVERLYTLYSTFTDLQKTKADMWEKCDTFSTYPYYDINAFNKLYEKSPKWKLPIDSLGIEYLIPYYFHKDSTIYPKLLDRVYQMVERKIYREYIHARQQILKYGYILKELPGLEGLDTTPGNFNISLRKQPKAKWLADPRFNLKEIDYVIKQYNLEDIGDIFSLVHYDGETYSKDNTIVKAYLKQDKEEILNTDISLLTRGAIINSFDDTRINTYWVAYLYKLILKEDKDTLNQYLLLEE